MIFKNYGKFKIQEQITMSDCVRKPVRQKSGIFWMGPRFTKEIKIVHNEELTLSCKSPGPTATMSLSTVKSIFHVQTSLKESTQGNQSL